MANFSRYVWLDGQLVAWNDATIHITQIGPASVSSVFEGICGYWNADARKLYLFHLAAHLDRLAQSMRLVRMKQTWSSDVLKQGIFDLLRANECTQDVYIRPFAFVDAPAFSVVSDSAARIIINTLPNPSRLHSGKVSHACVSSWTRISDNVSPPRVKASSNYLNSRYAAEEAKRNGYDVALLLQANGKVAEAPGACLMLVRDGKVVTPPTTGSILESITRATLIELCRNVLHLEVVEREVDRTELYIASEAFLCGTGSEITPLASIDRFVLGDGTIGRVARQLETLYHDLVRGIDPRYPEWRTEV